MYISCKLVSVCVCVRGADESVYYEVFSEQLF